jgi:hypothetical protein
MNIALHLFCTYFLPGGLTLWGLAGLWHGRLTFDYFGLNRNLRGWQARVGGVILAAAFPLSYFGGPNVGNMLGLHPRPFDEIDSSPAHAMSPEHLKTLQDGQAGLADLLERAKKLRDQGALPPAILDAQIDELEKQRQDGEEKIVAFRELEAKAQTERQQRREDWEKLEARQLDLERMYLALIPPVLGGIWVFASGCIRTESSEK